MRGVAALISLSNSQIAALEAKLQSLEDHDLLARLEAQTQS